MMTSYRFMMTFAQVRACLILLFLNGISGFNYLILHPFYSGSHVLTLHSVAERLVSQ